MAAPHRIALTTLLAGAAALSLAAVAQAGDRRGPVQDRYGPDVQSDARYEGRGERTVRGGERYSYERRESSYEAGVEGYVLEDADGRRGEARGYVDGYRDEEGYGYSRDYGEDDSAYRYDRYDDRLDERQGGARYGYDVYEGGRLTGYGWGYSERRDERYETRDDRDYGRRGRDCPDERYERRRDDERRWKDCKGSGQIRLSEGFFWGSGGVGPEYIGGGEGGGGVVVVGGAGAGASAYASASASASVSIRIGGGRRGHPGKPGGGHPGKPCGGCGSGGGKGH